jgi:hypothetical protein
MRLRDTGESCFFPPLTGNRDAVAFCDISGAVEVVVTCAYLQLLLTHDPKVTTIKLTRGLTVDWSIRDERLYATVCGGYPINVCAHCGSVKYVL